MRTTFQQAATAPFRSNGIGIRLSGRMRPDHIFLSPYLNCGQGSQLGRNSLLLAYDGSVSQMNSEDALKDVRLGCEPQPFPRTGSFGTWAWPNAGARLVSNVSHSLAFIWSLGTKVLPPSPEIIMGFMGKLV